jgi:hypothetical protein
MYGDKEHPYVICEKQLASYALLNTQLFEEL